MILNPSILALLLSSLLLTLLVGHAFLTGVRIADKWDITSGSELQLDLERSTYLVSTIMNMALVVQLLSLFLFIFTADSLHTRLSGAMCAAGSLAANAYGYPVLVLKIANFLLCGIWLVINHVDSRAYDYPLIGPKYLLLRVIAPLILMEAALQLLYFMSLRSRALTTCCGSQFDSGSGPITSVIVSLPPAFALSLFYACMAAVLASGIIFLAARRGALVFGILSAAALPVGIVSLVAFISPYYYELPTHHCPFCIMQGEYGHIGYPLYLALLGGGVAGISCGVLASFRGAESLRSAVPAVQKRLAAVAVALYAAFVLLVSWQLAFSSLRMVGG
ncbi:MAG: hypothetical protein HYV06_08155 [Deltaproteobacteria bacterium]|nr:hypothetical protein [Deltaproteobacteria bacterium]